jgi:hypothetical protein
MVMATLTHTNKDITPTHQRKVVIRTTMAMEDAAATASGKQITW